MSKPTLIAAIAGLALAATAARAEPLSVTWKIAQQRGATADDQVQLTLDVWWPRGGALTALPASFSTLRGLLREQLYGSERSQARFEMVRDAGRLDCEGSVGRGRGSGACRFTPDGAFAAALEQRGLRRPAPSEQLQLALEDVNLALLTELERQGYAAPTIPQLLAAGAHKVTAAYLQSLDAVGYRAGSIDKLVALRIFNIDAERIAALAEVSPRLKDLPADTLVAMSIHGVTPEFVREAMAAGSPEATPDELIKLRVLGQVSPRNGHAAGSSL